MQLISPKKCLSLQLIDNGNTGSVRVDNLKGICQFYVPFLEYSSRMSCLRWLDRIHIWSNLSQLDDFSKEFGIGKLMSLEVAFGTCTWSGKRIKQRWETYNPSRKKMKKLAALIPGNCSFCSSVLCLSALPAPRFLKVPLKPHKETAPLPLLVFSLSSRGCYLLPNNAS